MSALNFDNLYEEANRALGEGRFEDCDRLCRSILDHMPRNVPALVLAGIAADRQGRLTDAVSLFLQAVRSDPNCGPAYLWLSMTERKTGDPDAALAHAAAAARLSPNDSFALNHFGQCQFDQGELKSAETAFRRALALAPNIPQNHLSLGIALRALNRREEAAAALRRAMELNPSDWRPRQAIRDLLVEMDDLPSAIEMGREMARLLPESSEAALWLATALLEHGDPAEAGRYAAMAVEFGPDSAEARTSLGVFLQHQGKLQEAEEEFRRAIALEPRRSAAYLAIAATRRILEADRPFVESIRGALEDKKLSVSDRSQLCYALGKSLEDLAEYREAMERYDEANRLAQRVRSGEKPPGRPDYAPYERFAALFTPDSFPKRPETEPTGPTPILVVGMLRSGTTLAEQILSRHPEVGPAGEQRFWLEHTQALVGAARMPDLGRLRGLSEDYLQRLSRLAPGKRFVVDKMPTNYLILGLLRLALPQAKIVHMRRHPADTCVSIYATPNRTRLGWAHDKRNIVDHYRLYERLMDRWRAVLGDALIEVRYEDLVSSPEVSIRTLVEGCGLDWSENCLHPEENDRAVSTPSFSQVRRPIYKTSVERWKRFEPWLGPFRELAV